MTPPRQPDEGSDAAFVPAEVGRLLTLDPATCTDAEVADAVLALAAGVDAIECALIRWVSALDGRTIWTGDGSRSPGAWISARTELGRATAAAKVHTARDLRSCPSLEASYRAGRLGTAKVRAALHARKAWPDLFAEHEPTIVTEIEPLTVDEALTVLRRWATLATQLRASAADPDGPDGTRNPAADNHLHLSTTFGGTVVGDLELDPVAGAELTEAVNARIDQLFDSGVFHAADGLTMSARRAWALRDLVEDGAKPGTRQGRPRPSVSLLLDERTAAGDAIDGVDDLLARRCELTDGTPVPRSTAERLLCTCTLTALLQRTLADGKIEILGVTDTLRDATWRQRAALATRDGGCVFPGCHSPVNRCEAHHLHPHEHGGPTVLDNLALLCRFHHHAVHEGGWRLWRASDGHLYLQDPVGRPVALVRPGTKAGDAPPPSTPPEPPPPYPVRTRFRS